MRNVDYTVSEDNILNIQINLNDDFGVAQSGKSITVGTTDGFEKLVDHDAWFILTCNRKLNAS